MAENIALFYDGWNLVAEVDAGTNAVIAKYIHGARIDELISKTAGNSTVYYLADHLGSVRTLTDENGAIVESYRYEAFGKPTVYNATGAASASSAHGNRFMFTGREFLSEIGIYDYRNRNYSPELGRFLQNDPIRFEAGDVNLYRYVENKLIRIQDPFGLDPGHIFSSQDAAAADAVAYYEQASGETRHEFCGGVCRDGDNYYATDGLEGTNNNCPDPGKNEDQSCPEGEIVGAYHIHPQGTESHPSELDMEFVENNNVDLYTYYAETETLSVLDANEEVCKQVAP